MLFRPLFRERFRPRFRGVLGGGAGGSLFSYAPGLNLATRATFSRNRMAGYTESDGDTASAAVNEPRDDHYIDSTRTLLLTN